MKIADLLSILMGNKTARPWNSIRIPPIPLIHIMKGVICCEHRSRRFVTDKGDNHAVEVEEEHDQVEPELEE